MHEKELIAEFSKLKIKKFLKSSVNNFIKIHHVEQIFNLSEKEAIKLMKSLEVLGYVTYLSNLSAWTNTLQGDWLAHQTVHRKIKRKDAETIIEDIIKRITIANTSESYLWQVHLAFVYGDFIRKEMNELRDLSIGLIISMKNKDTYKKMAYLMANESKKPLPNVGDVQMEPYLELLRFLKDQQHNVHLRTFNDISSFKDEQVEIIFNF